ncbi:MAG TPA: prolipoprotein diacylglyceryl transferase [Gammaproteobacteria bacterium]|jgi:phosphatidylglycerol:prolipoprotein diacylglycerol transferase
MLVHPDFDPVVFHIAGPLAIRWYGLMYLIGFVAAWWLGRVRAKQPHSALTPHQVDDMVFYGMIGVIVGGRIGSTLFYHFPEFIGNPLIVFRIWDGGMSFHGGFLGVLLVMWWYAKKQQLAFFTLMDFVAPLVPLGLGAGRMGNFINQELVGRPTDLPWGMIFPVTGDGIPRHPSQLYQATLEGLVLFLVLWFYSAKSPPRMAVSALFLSGYGLFRFAVEFVRTPDAHLGFIALGWLTMGQILSLPMIVIGVWMLWYSYQNKVTESA